MAAPPTPEQRRVRVFTGAAIICGLVLAYGLTREPLRVWSNLLIAAFFLLALGLGGAVFVALAYLCGASWHVAFRRVPEALAATLPISGGVMLMVLAAGMNSYGWSSGEQDAGSFWFKQTWLTPSFWLARAAGYVLLWVLLSSWLLARSRKQDQTGDPRVSSGSTRLSAVFLAVYAVTFTLAGVDWTMALEPLWFSTMWGVYQFSGMIQAAIAAIVVLALFLRSPRGPLRGVFSDEHLHDLGKLLLGFSCFWMYIWFSQYMLIWYSNIPEETSYFIARVNSPWGPVVVLSILLNWVVPFFVLLPRPAKRSASVMMKIAAVVLIGRWVDLYLMVLPSTIGATPAFGLWEVAAIGLLASASALLLLRAFAAANPVPSRDPFLAESMHYHAS